jgi:hypothetical protein
MAGTSGSNFGAGEVTVDCDGSEIDHQTVSGAFLLDSI